VLPFGQTTAPNSHSATIALRKTGAAATINFVVTAGRLPPGLSMPALIALQGQGLATRPGPELPDPYTLADV
jgi:hypothetical protein